MKFIREISTKNITNINVPIDNFGFTLVWKEDSVEVWYSEDVSAVVQPGYEKINLTNGKSPGNIE